MLTVMDGTLEIRKLPQSIVRELAFILDYADSWKKLMAVVPKKLVLNDYVCDIPIDNLPKYNSEHLKLIEQASIQSKRSCTEIFIDEWGTSGRPRARLGHLKHLLVKAELYRAADYIAKLLNEEPPSRPSSGPAAAIPTGLSQINNNELEEILHNLNYTNISTENCATNDLDNIANQVRKPESGTPFVQNEIFPEGSDMIKFSIDLNSTVDNNEIPNMPEWSVLLNDSPVQDTIARSSSQGDIPAFSQILDSNDHMESSNDNFPALSVLNQSVSQSEVIPNFDILQSRSGELSLPVISTSPKLASSGCSNKCSSPLPNLSLNTQLPHFTYCELENATNNFSEVPFTSDKDRGRFLGAGAFGSVYLATGLSDTPMAVKKIFLEDVEVVNEDDEVTKQFKNEVELLSKYKHENLVSLLGYSCDGCTYCLVYEYVPGGSLFDTLEKNPRLLNWQQRINIASGTAKAVAYLHTAFTMPLIHRDIKSANILLDTFNNPKLCDFGVVKLLPSQKTATHTELYGTSAYMSPEYHRGDISIKLDSFSFGVVLLELLTSLAPVDYNRQGNDLVTYVDDKCEDDITPLLDKNVGTWIYNEINFAGKLYDIALKCLEDKKKRPVMVEVCSLLDDIQNSLNQSVDL